MAAVPSQDAQRIPVDDDAVRDTTDLWALSETALCALKRCIPCSYKLLVNAPSVVDGEKLSPPCHKNVRPELCPRQDLSLARRIEAAQAAARERAAEKANAAKKATKDSDDEDEQEKSEAEEDGEKSEAEEDGEKSEAEEDGEKNGAPAAAAAKSRTTVPPATSSSGDADQKASGKEEEVPHARAGLYSEKDRILVVGDGDFTFSLALATALGPNAHIVCTSYQSGKEVREIYSEADTTLQSLSAFPRATVQHGVDAVRLVETLDEAAASGDKFTRILFNFPCIPDDVGKDGQADQIEANQALVRGFLLGAGALLADGGEAHVTHKTRAPFGWWGISGLCPAASGCAFTRAVVFDRSAFPLYIPRKVGENKSFPVFDAVTYCFRKTAAPVTSAQLEPGVEAAEAATTHMSPDLVAKYSLVKLTERRLMQVVALLQLATSSPVAAHLVSKKRPRTDFSRGPAPAENKRQKGKKGKKGAQKRKGKR